MFFGGFLVLKNHQKALSFEMFLGIPVVTYSQPSASSFDERLISRPMTSAAKAMRLEEWKDMLGVVGCCCMSSSSSSSSSRRSSSSSSSSSSALRPQGLPTTSQVPPYLENKG